MITPWPDTIQRGIVADPDSASSSTGTRIFVEKHFHPIHSFATLSLTAQSGEESILVASLRGVIAKQAAEIEALQNKLKELTATSLATAEAAASEASQNTAKFAEVCYIPFYHVWLHLL